MQFALLQLSCVLIVVYHSTATKDHNHHHKQSNNYNSQKRLEHNSNKIKITCTFNGLHKVCLDHIETNKHRHVKGYDGKVRVYKGDKKKKGWAGHRYSAKQRPKWGWFQVVFISGKNGREAFTAETQVRTDDKNRFHEGSKQMFIFQDYEQWFGNADEFYFNNKYPGLFSM